MAHSILVRDPVLKIYLRTDTMVIPWLAHTCTLQKACTHRLSHTHYIVVITAELDKYTRTIKLHTLMDVLYDRQVHLTERIKTSTAASAPW